MNAWYDLSQPKSRTYRRLNRRFLLRQVTCQPNMCRDIIIESTPHTFFAFFFRLIETMFSSEENFFSWHKHFDSKRKRNKEKEKKLKFESSISSGMNNSWVKISWIFYRKQFSFFFFPFITSSYKHFNKKSISDLAIN